MTAVDIARQLSAEGFGTLTPLEAARFEIYLGLLMKWNKKLNLTSIRTESEIVSRHFGESIQCARALPGIRVHSLLDFGSGSGFPGVPCAICLPSVRVTLAEAHAKKAAFLSEVQRHLGIDMEIHAGRVEALPAESLFDAVALRAVEQMELACELALRRVKKGGVLMIFTTIDGMDRLQMRLQGVNWLDPRPIACSEQRILLQGRKSG